MARRPGPPSPAQRDTTPFPPLHLAREYPPSLVASRLRTGAWVRVRRGVYIDAEVARAKAGSRRLALARALAAHNNLDGDHVLSHSSAALVAGLSLRIPPRHVHITQPWRPRSGIAADVVRHVWRLPAEHRTTIRGLPSTTLARTLADCAAAQPPLDALITLDSGLHLGVDRAEVATIIQSFAGRRGVVQARELLEVADDGAESPGETWTRWVLLGAGLPRPETQVEVATPEGRFWSDLGWREWRLLVEYDGRGKYDAPGGAAEVLLAERRRQEAIEEAGWRLVRVVKEDLRAPDRLIERVVRWIPPTSRAFRPRRLLAG